MESKGWFSIAAEVYAYPHYSFQRRQESVCTQTESIAETVYNELSNRKQDIYQQVLSLEEHLKSIRKELTDVSRNLVRKSVFSTRYVHIFLSSNHEWATTIKLNGLESKYINCCEEDIEKYNALKIQESSLASSIKELRQEIRACEQCLSEND
jgi:septal ring factor EnvC (AmiA/AmiB activator)